MEGVGFQRFLVRGGSAQKEDDRCTLYVEDLTELFRRQVKFWGKQNFMFRSEQRNTLSRVAF